MFCSNCGKEINDGSAFCKYCGTKIGESNPSKDDKKLAVKNSSNCSRLVAFILAWFFGGFGAHDFYVGKKKLGIAKLIILIIAIVIAVLTDMSEEEYIFLAAPTLLWTLYDLIMIIIGKYTDKYGLPLKRWIKD